MMDPIHLFTFGSLDKRNYSAQMSALPAGIVDFWIVKSSICVISNVNVIKCHFYNSQRLQVPTGHMLLYSPSVLQIRRGNRDN